MSLRVLWLLGFAAIIAGAGLAQTPRLTFDVASVKPADPARRAGGGVRPLPGGQSYVATNASLRTLITLMYRIADVQVVGGPSWMSTDLWDIDAKAEHPSNLDQLHEMFQNLLADRFKLKFHRESKEIAAYVLSVDRAGSKLKVSKGTDPYDVPIKPGDKNGQSIGTRVPMSYLCYYLARFVGAPVVDKTGLDGFYDFTFELPLPAPLPPAATGVGITEPAPPDWVGIVRDQLGLKLESKKAPVEVFVIDRAERPSAN